MPVSIACACSVHAGLLVLHTLWVTQSSVSLRMRDTLFCVVLANASSRILFASTDSSQRIVLAKIRRVSSPQECGNACEHCLRMQCSCGFAGVAHIVGHAIECVSSSARHIVLCCTRECVVTHFVRVHRFFTANCACVAWPVSSPQKCGNACEHCELRQCLCGVAGIALKVKQCESC